MGRLLHLEDGQRADGLRLRGFQGHLSVRIHEGAERLHHVPIQSRGIPGRAGQGQGSGEHHLSLRPRGRQRRRGQG